MNEYEVAKELAQMSIQTLLAFHELFEDYIRKSLQDKRIGIQASSIGSYHITVPKALDQKAVWTILSQDNNIHYMQDDDKNLFINRDNFDAFITYYKEYKEKEIIKEKAVLEELNIPYKEAEKTLFITGNTEQDMYQLTIAALYISKEHERLLPANKNMHAIALEKEQYQNLALHLQEEQEKERRKLATDFAQKYSINNDNIFIHHGAYYILLEDVAIPEEKIQKFEQQNIFLFQDKEKFEECKKEFEFKEPSQNLEEEQELVLIPDENKEENQEITEENADTEVSHEILSEDEITETENDALTEEEIKKTQESDSLETEQEMQAVSEEELELERTLSNEDFIDNDNDIEQSEQSVSNITEEEALDITEDDFVEENEFERELQQDENDFNVEQQNLSENDSYQNQDDTNQENNTYFSEDADITDVYKESEEISNDNVSAHISEENISDVTYTNNLEDVQNTEIPIQKAVVFEQTETKDSISFPETVESIQDTQNDSQVIDENTSEQYIAQTKEEYHQTEASEKSFSKTEQKVQEVQFEAETERKQTEKQTEDAYETEKTPVPASPFSSQFTDTQINTTRLQMPQSIDNEQDKRNELISSMEQVNNSRNEGKSIDGYEFKAGEKLITNPYHYFLDQLEKDDSLAKGIKETKKYHDFTVSVLDNTSLAAVVASEKINLEKIYTTKGVKEHFEKMGYEGTYNLDKLQTRINTNYANTMLTKEKMHLGLEERKMFAPTDNSGITRWNMKAVMKNPEKFKVTKYGQDFLQTANAAEAANILKFYKKAESVKQMQKKIEKGNVFKKSQKVVAKNIRKSGSESTDGFLQISDTTRNVLLMRKMQQKLSDKKMELKHKYYQNSALRYQQKISNLEKTSRTMSKQISVPADKKQMDEYMDILKKKKEKKLKKEKEYREKIEKRQKKLEEKKEKQLRNKLKNKGKDLINGRKAREMAKLEKMANKALQKGNYVLAEKIQKQIAKKKTQALKKKAKKERMKRLKERVLQSRFAKGFTTISKIKAKIMQALSSILKIVALYLGIALAGMFIFYITVTKFLDYAILLRLNPIAMITNQEDDVFKLTYEVLDAAEKNWVEDIWNFTDPDNNATLKDYEDEINWQEVLSGTVYKYNNGVISWDPLGLGDDVSLSKVDGGLVAEFKNLNDPTRLSNLKDIMSMATVYYEYSGASTDALNYLNQDALNALKEVWANPSSTIEYKGFKGLWNKLFHRNKTNPIGAVLYADDTDTVVLGAYALTLFQASHDIDIDFNGIRTYPIYVKAPEAIRDFAVQNGNTDGAGNLILCTEKKGCYAVPGENFYFTGGGGVNYKNHSTTADGKAISSIVYIKDEDCSSIPDSRKDGHRCWEKVEITETHTEAITNSDGSQAYKPSGEAMYYTYTTTRIEYHHKCAGHAGRICAGHVSIKATGKIHSFNEQDTHFIENDFAKDDSLTIEHEEYNKDAGKNVFYDTPEIKYENIADTDDIFKSDAESVHVYVPSSWTGWTTQLKKSVLTRFSDSWKQLYGIEDIDSRNEQEIFARKHSHSGFGQSYNQSNIDPNTYVGLEDLDKMALIIRQREGNYGSINANDNGGVSIGIFQWHENRALNLMRNICKQDPETAKKILGDALYQEIMNSGTSWVGRITNKSESQKLSILLSTDIGKQEQDALYKNDIKGYVATVASKGISDVKAQAFLADIVNQYGSLCNHAYATIVDNGGTLDAAYDTLVTNHFVCSTCGRRYDAYAERRTAVKYAVEAAFGK